MADIPDITPLLSSLDPNPLRFFDTLRPIVTPEMLRSISSIDYFGDQSECYATLTEILRTGVVPSTVSWDFNENVSLTSYLDPEDRVAPECGARDGHIIRVLCCGIRTLIRDQHYCDENHELCRLVCSTLMLDHELQKGVASLLAWHAQRADDHPIEPLDLEEEPSELAYVSLALCALIAHNERLVSPDDARRAAQWLAYTRWIYAPASNWMNWRQIVQRTLLAPSPAHAQYVQALFRDEGTKIMAGFPTHE